MNVQPQSANLSERLERDPAARRAVSQAVREWMKATRGDPRTVRPPISSHKLAVAARRLFAAPPVYYLWDRDGEFPPRGGTAICAAPAPEPRRSRRPDAPAAQPPRRHRTALRAADDSAAPRTDDRNTKDRHRP